MSKWKRERTRMVRVDWEREKEREPADQEGVEEEKE